MLLKILEVLFLIAFFAPLLIKLLDWLIKRADRTKRGEPAAPGFQAIKVGLEQSLQREREHLERSKMSDDELRSLFRAEHYRTDILFSGTQVRELYVENMLRKQREWEVARGIRQAGT